MGNDGKMFRARETARCRIAALGIRSFGSK